MSRILFVDDDPGVRETAARLLAKPDRAVETAGTVAEARRRVGGPWDAVLVDLGLPDGDGLEVLRASIEADPARPVVVITGQGSVASAVAAMRAGARDYIEKPFDPDALRLSVDRLLEEAETRRERDALRGEAARLRAAEAGSYRGLVGSTPAMRRIFEEIERVGPTASTVLITGESGTGKELVARALHEASGRKGRFVATNCAAIPATLLEGEIFGYERGAFTGAVRAKPGLFEQADRGTIFLDEVAEIPPALQAKLLRVLQDGESTRLGATAPHRCDVRVVAATNREIGAEVAAGRFREDLYYRLAVIPIALPPLRDRRPDIAAIAAHVLGRLERRAGRPLRLSPAAAAALESYDWPGNVRELENALERAVALETTPTILPESLPEPVRTGGGRVLALVPRTGENRPLLPEGGFDLEQHIRALEREYIAEALRRANGVKVRAAELLGMSFRSFRYYLKKYNLS